MERSETGYWNPARSHSPEILIIYCLCATIPFSNYTKNSDLCSALMIHLMKKRFFNNCAIEKDYQQFILCFSKLSIKKLLH